MEKEAYRLKEATCGGASFFTAVERKVVFSKGKRDNMERIIFFLKLP
jgi:hypothetical protein